MILARRTEPLRHEVVSSVVSTRAGKLEAELTRLGATAQTSKRQARELLKAAGIKTSDTVILAALKLIEKRAERDGLLDFSDFSGSEPPPGERTA